MDENQIPFVINVPKSKLRTFAPLISALLVSILVITMQNNMSFGSGLFRITIAPALGGQVVEQTKPSLLIPFAWVASALTVTTIFIASILGCFFVIWQTMVDSEFKWQRAVPATLLVFTGAIAYGIVLLIGPGSALDGPLEAIYPSYVSLQRPPFTYFMDVLAIWKTLMLTAAFCTMSAPLAPKKSVLGQLSKRAQFTTLLLYLGAITLTIAVIQFNLLFRLTYPADINKMSVVQMDTLAAGFSLILGTYSSLLLAALYVPTALILAAEVHALAFTQRQASTLDQLTAWLSQHGLTFPGHHHTSRLFLLLAPLLTGWLGEPVVRAIGSLLAP